LFGNDYMVLPDFTVKLLETNIYLGMATSSKEVDKMHEKLFDGILQKTIDTIVPPKNKISVTDDFILV
jgi:hypothetical protein